MTAARRTRPLSVAAAAVLAAVAAGCRGAPQHAVPGCPHPVAAAFSKVEQFRDGLALEKAQWRTEDDTTELRLTHAHAKTSQTTDCVKAHVRQTAHTAKAETGSVLRRLFCPPWRR